MDGDHRSVDLIEPASNDRACPGCAPVPSGRNAITGTHFSVGGWFPKGQVIWPVGLDEVETLTLRL